MKEQGRFLFFFVILTAAVGTAYTQTSGLQAGIRLYGEGKWRDAVVELRRVQAAQPSQRAEAQYWIFLAELAAGEYDAAIQDIEELERIDPRGPRGAEIPYHKGRVLYYLGRYDEAVVLLKSYADGIDEVSLEDGTRKAAALYWIGECLFSMGQLDRAFEVFTLVTDQYPQSVKFEAASYRIALINQKKVESELLTILKWSHEESLKTVEEYQRRERSYDQAIIAYQKRIAEMLKDSRLAELENANADYQKRLADAEARIAALQASLTVAEDTIIALRTNRPPQTTVPSAAPGSDQTLRLLSLKASALEVRNELMNQLNEQVPPGEGGE
jgi:TolA-binding protein